MHWKTLTIGILCIWCTSAQSFTVIDPTHIALQTAQWGLQRSEMVSQGVQMAQQITNQAEQIAHQIEQIQRMDINLQTLPLLGLYNTWYNIIQNVQKIRYSGNGLSYQEQYIRGQFDQLFPGKTYGYPVAISPTATWEEAINLRLNWNAMRTDQARHAMLSQAEQEQFNNTGQSLFNAMEAVQNAPGNLQAVRANGLALGIVAQQLQQVRQLLATNGRLAAINVANDAAEERLSMSEYLRIHCPQTPALAAMVHMPGCTQPLTSSTGTIGDIP